MRSFAILVAVILMVQTRPARPLGTWSEKAQLGEQRTEAAVVFLNRKIYLIGAMARGQAVCRERSLSWRQ